MSAYYLWVATGGFQWWLARRKNIKRKLNKENIAFSRQNKICQSTLHTFLPLVAQGKPDVSATIEEVSSATYGYRESSFKNLFNVNHILAITHTICPGISRIYFDEAIKAYTVQRYNVTRNKVTDPGIIIDKETIRNVKIKIGFDAPGETHGACRECIINF